MLYLHRILTALATPTGLVMLLLLYALLRRRRGWSRQGWGRRSEGRSTVSPSSWSLWLALALLWLSSAPVVTTPFIRFTEGYTVRLEASDLAAALASNPAPLAPSAAVILGGYTNPAPGPGGQPRTEWADSADRVFAGLELYQAGVVPRLILTGGKLPWMPLSPTDAEFAIPWLLRMGVAQSDLGSTGEVGNTDAEAQAVAQQLPPGAHIVLVTSAFHMRRAAYLFRQAGLRVTPFAVDFRSTQRDFAPQDLLPNPTDAHYFANCVREWIGLFYYWLKSL